MGVTEKNLRERWSPDEIRRMNDLLAQGGSRLKELARIEVDGESYIDLRGLSVDDFVKGAELRRVDLSYAQVARGGQLGQCTVEDCRFLSAHLDTNIGNKFARCDFAKANLKRALLYGEFADCDFSGANMAKVQGGRLRLVGCRLDQVRLDWAELQDSVFERCRFRSCSVKDASFAGARFVNCAIEGVDFSTALMDGVSFS